MTERLKPDKAPEPHSGHLGPRSAPFDAGNNNIASFTQGDLRRFIVNLLHSDPGAIPAESPDTAKLPSAPLDGDIPVWDRASQRWVLSSMPKLQTVDPWHTATLLGTWVNKAGEPTAAYYKDPFDRVWLRGTVQSGAVPSTIFTLPVGYRPPDNYRRYVVIATSGTDSQGYIYIDSSGNVVFNYGNTAAEVDLNQISFRLT